MIFTISNTYITRIIFTPIYITILEVINASTNSVTYTLKFPTYSSKSVIYLEELTLNKLVNNNWQNVFHRVRNSEQGIPAEWTNLQKGIYQVVYKDNFEPLTYSYILYVGEYYINNFL